MQLHDMTAPATSRARSDKAVGFRLGRGDHAESEPRLGEEGPNSNSNSNHRLDHRFIKPLLSYESSLSSYL
jgi:hypothetical protein